MLLDSSFSRFPPWGKQGPRRTLLKSRGEVAKFRGRTPRGSQTAREVRRENSKEETQGVVTIEVHNWRLVELLCFASSKNQAPLCHEMLLLRNKCLTSSNKKLLGTSATLLGTSALLVVTVGKCGVLTQEPQSRHRQPLSSMATTYRGSETDGNIFIWGPAQRLPGLFPASQRGSPALSSNFPVC